jgi:hypothetical protein
VEMQFERIGEPELELLSASENISGIVGEE